MRHPLRYIRVGCHFRYLILDLAKLAERVGIHGPKKCIRWEVVIQVVQWVVLFELLCRILYTLDHDQYGVLAILRSQHSSR